MDREQVPFDEAALVKSIGLDYVQIPMNGNKAYPKFSWINLSRPTTITAEKFCCTVAVQKEPAKSGQRSW